MKVALCISGHLRCGLDLFPNIKKSLLDVYNPDIYIYLWEECEKLDPESNVFIQTKDKIKEDTISKIVDSFRPKEIIIANNTKFISSLPKFNLSEHNINFINKKKQNCPSVYSLKGFFSQHYANWKSMQLPIASGKNYDIIIRHRFDTYFTKKINANIFSLSLNNIVVPNNLKFGGLNDRFALGPPKYMNIYSSLFFNLYRFCVIDGVRYHPESLLKLLIEKNKIPFIEENIPMDTIRKVENVLFTASKDVICEYFK